MLLCRGLGVGSFSFPVGLFLVDGILGGLTTNDQECREGRDAAEGHCVGWW